MPRRPTALFALALPALLAAPSAAPALVVYGNGNRVSDVQNLPAPVKQELAAKVPGAAGARLGFVYKYFHIYWIPLWTYEGTHAIYVGDQYWPLTPQQVQELTGKTPEDLGKPFWYRVPPGLLALGGIVLLCVLVSALRKRGAAPPPGAPTLDQMIPDRPAEPAHFCYLQLYQPDEVLRQRLPSVEELGRFSQDVERAVAEFAAEERLSGQALSLFAALRPGGRSRFWLEFRPGGVSQEREEALLRRLERVRPPAVSGEVALASYALLWGGPGHKNDVFAFAPRAWVEALGPAGGVIPDDALSRAWPQT